MQTDKMETNNEDEERESYDDSESIEDEPIRPPPQTTLGYAALNEKLDSFLKSLRDRLNEPLFIVIVACVFAIGQYALSKFGINFQTLVMKATTSMLTLSMVFVVFRTLPLLHS